MYVHTYMHIYIYNIYMAKLHGATTAAVIPLHMFIFHIQSCFSFACHRPRATKKVGTEYRRGILYIYYKIIYNI